MPHSAIRFYSAEAYPASTAFGPGFQNFLSVSEEEIAFALSFFVCAAKGHFPSAGTMVDPARQDGCTDLFLALTALRFAPLFPSRTPARHHRTLKSAFASLWQHYAADSRCPSICARVLAFYLLMERTEGLAIAHWVCPVGPDDEEVILHPAIVQALATSPLDQTGLRENDFLALVNLLANAPATSDGDSNDGS